MGFIDQFKAAHRVSTPLLSIRTFDAKSTIDRIKGIWTNANKELPPVMYWDCIKGFTVSAKDEKSKTVLTDAMQKSSSMPELTASLKETLRVCNFLAEDCIIFVSNAHMQLDGPDRVEIIQAIWNLRDYFKAKGCMLLLMTSNGAIMPVELASDVLTLDEPLPTKAELAVIVSDTFKNGKAEKNLTDAITADATKALIGLPAFPAEQATAMCLENGKLDMSGLWERKRQAINATRGLQVLQTDANLDNIGGLEQFKTFLEQVMTGNNPPNVILLWDEIEKSFAGMGTDTSGTTTKMGGNVLSWSNDTGMAGIIGVGVPGAGKSEVVKAVANKYGKLCIAFNLADMESGLVGSSNEYLRNAQAVIDSISDKKVLSIATCNSIESLPPEIKRRFANKGIFFFDAPTEVERASIWDVYRNKYSIPASDPTPNDKGWTGAEIRNCALNAYELKITLRQAANYIVPVTVSDAGKIATLRNACSGKYLSASHPGVYQYMGEETETPSIPETVTGRKMR